MLLRKRNKNNANNLRSCLKITANNRNESIAIQWNILNNEFYNALPERKATISIKQKNEPLTFKLKMLAIFKYVHVSIKNIKNI